LKQKEAADTDDARCFRRIVGLDGQRTLPTSDIARIRSDFFAQASSSHRHGAAD
jgi:hypothetical protein